MNVRIEESTLKFLRALGKNNNREWFSQNKTTYLHAQENVAQFLDGLLEKMNQHDRLETRSGKESLYRIYNDVRFSEDKTPYNPRFAGNFRREKPALRGGYYYWIKPGESRIGCGFTYPNAADLLRIRQDIERNHRTWKKLLATAKLVNSFGALQGNQVKTAPRGFAKDHAAIALLRYKQFWFERSFSDREVLAADFSDQINRHFQSIRPFFNYTSEVLTTDLNGEHVV